MNPVIDHELIFSRAYEHALSSAFARGSTLTDFSFVLPQPDDVLVFANGNKALRIDTHDSGYSDDELALHTVLMRNMGAQYVAPLRIPSAFLNDTDTILESHRNDLSEIARGLIRDAAQRDAINSISTLADIFTAFARASLAFHESLLSATEALLHIDHAPTAAHLMHKLFPALLEAQESLTLAARRFSHTNLEQTIEKGAKDQICLFLTFGEEYGHEKDFFGRHLLRFDLTR